MNNNKELLERIRSGLSVLEQGVQEEDYDLITALFTILHGITHLLATTCDKGKIKDWQDRDEAAFNRFASQLKIGLELQRNYLDSVSDLLMLENDTVSQKIATAQAQIHSLLEQEQTVLKEALPLFEQEKKLREISSRVKTLLSKRDELATLEQELAAVDESALSAEIEQREKETVALKNSHAPLINKQKEQQKSTAELTEMCAIAYGAALVANDLITVEEKYEHTIGIASYRLVPIGDGRTYKPQPELIPIIQGGKKLSSYEKVHFAAHPIKTHNEKPEVTIYVDVNTKNRPVLKTLPETLAIRLPNISYPDNQWQVGMRINKSKAVYLVFKDIHNEIVEYEISDLLRQMFSELDLIKEE